MKQITMRNTVFEIIRLLAMFMIVLEHGLLATVLNTTAPLTKIDNIAWFIESYTVCAVNLFFLLTGYFAQSGKFKFSRLAKIWLKTIFYSLIIYLISVVLGKDIFQIKILITYICPILFKKYWFIQTYIVLVLLAPFIVNMLERLSRKIYLFLISILILFFSLHQTFIPVNYSLDSTQGYGISWAITLLIVGKFLNLHAKKYIININAKWWMIGYTIIASCIFISNYLIVKLNIAQGITSRANFYSYNSLTVFLESVLLFCFFISLSKKKFENKIINWFSSSAISVYLISSHPNLLFSLWNDVFNVQQYLLEPFLFFGIIILLSIIILLLCIAIDKILEYIFAFIPINNILDKLDKTKINEDINNI